MGFPIRFRTIGVSLFVTLLSTTTLLAQTVIVEELPDSIKIPVTFFDFHSDKSNPEFECDHMSGKHENMADSTLPEDKIPRLGRSPILTTTSNTGMYLGIQKMEVKGIFHSQLHFYRLRV